MQKVNKIKSPFTKEVYTKNAELFKVLANAKRLEILSAVAETEATVNELSKLLGTRKSNTSQHLAYLRYTGLVVTRRQGKNVFYRISDSRIVEPFKIFNEIRVARSLKKSSQVI